MARLVRTAFPAAMAASLALSGCASQRGAGPVQLSGKSAVPPAMPTLPAGIPATLNVPPVGADGVYRTINYGLGGADAVWHVRSALNVAALACRGAGEGAIIAAYNALLKTQRKPLATALKTIEARYRTERGKGWQAEHDVHMTKLYNFFAQPAAQQAFCTVAASVVAEAGTVAPGDFAAFSERALPSLEAPFTAVYSAYDGYRRDLAAWQATYGNVAYAAATPAPARPAGDGVPKLAYAGMHQLLLWDSRDLPIRTASR